MYRTYFKICISLQRKKLIRFCNKLQDTVHLHRELFRRGVEWTFSIAGSE